MLTREARPAPLACQPLGPTIRPDWRTAGVPLTWKVPRPFPVRRAQCSDSRRPPLSAPQLAPSRLESSRLDLAARPAVPVGRSSVGPSILDRRRSRPCWAACGAALPGADLPNALPFRAFNITGVGRRHVTVGAARPSPSSSRFVRRSFLAILLGGAVARFTPFSQGQVTRFYTPSSSHGVGGRSRSG